MSFSYPLRKGDRVATATAVGTVIKRGRGVAYVKWDGRKTPMPYWPLDGLCKPWTRRARQGDIETIIGRCAP